MIHLILKLDSDIQVPNLFLHYGTANIKGTYSPTVSSLLFVQPTTGGTTLIFTTGANIVRFPERTSVSQGGKIVFESAGTDLNFELVISLFRR